MDLTNLSPSILNDVSVFVVLSLLALAIITDKLVWHTRFRKLEEDRDKWQEIALNALRGPAQAGVRAAEVAVGVIQSIPDPQAERESAGRD